VLKTKKNNSRLDEYFTDCHSELKANGNQSTQDWQEFYNKSFYTSRNVETNELINQLNPILPEEIDCIADNVMIYSSLSGCLKEIVANGFMVTDKVAYDFVKKRYDIKLSASGWVYVNDIYSGKDLESVIADYKKSSSSYLVAIGGGRTLDYAKFISLKTGSKLLSIPSSLATHVYASPKIHALDPIKKLGYEMTIDGNPAHLTLIDIDLLSYLHKTNQRLVFSGFGDIMAFINAQNDWKESAKKGKERFSLFVDESIDLIIKMLTNIDVTQPLSNWISEYIFIQCLLCHITDWVGSAPASGAEHLFAKCIDDEVSDTALHGEVVALGVLIFCYIRNKDVELTKFLMEKFKISNVLPDLGVNKDAVLRSLVRSGSEGLKKGRYTILQDLDNSFEFFQSIIEKMIDEKLIRES